jgi:hypothetical protein
VEKLMGVHQLKDLNGISKVEEVVAKMFEGARKEANGTMVLDLNTIQTNSKKDSYVRGFLTTMLQAED